MPKVIHNAYECGYLNIEENYREGICKHSKNLCSNCPGPEFPTNCPLQDSIPVPKTIEDVILMAKTEGLLYEVDKKQLKLQAITLMEKVAIVDRHYNPCSTCDTDCPGRNNCKKIPWNIYHKEEEHSLGLDE